MWKPKDNLQKVIAIASWFFIFIFFINILSKTNVNMNDAKNPSLAIFMVVFLYLLFVKPKNYKEMKIEQEKAAEARKLQISESGMMTYLGGGLLDREELIFVSVTSSGIKYDKEFIPIDCITNVAMETQAQVTSRLTATRMVAFGVFSLAMPKRSKTNTKFLTVDYDDGFPSTLVLEGKNATKLQSALIRAKKKSLNKH